MRGKKAKLLRRQAYGKGNAMPRHQHHEYRRVHGTLLIVSARRLYKRLKQGQEVQVLNV